MVNPFPPEFYEKYGSTHDSTLVYFFDEYIQFLHPKPNFNKQINRLAFNCQPLCTHNLHRPHFSCLFTCRHRKAYYNKVPKQMRIQIYTLLIWKDRPHAYIKMRLLKAVLSIAEMLAN